MAAFKISTPNLKSTWPQCCPCLHLRSVSQICTVFIHHWCFNLQLPQNNPTAPGVLFLGLNVSYETRFLYPHSMTVRFEEDASWSAVSLLFVTWLHKKVIIKYCKFQEYTVSIHHLVWHQPLMKSCTINVWFIGCCSHKMLENTWAGAMTHTVHKV